MEEEVSIWRLSAFFNFLRGELVDDYITILGALSLDSEWLSTEMA